MLIGWDTLQIGLAYGTALSIGGFLGETAGGWVVDLIMVSEYSTFLRSFASTIG